MDVHCGLALTPEQKSSAIAELTEEQISIVTALANGGQVLAMTEELYNTSLMGERVRQLVQCDLLEEWTTGRPEDEYLYFQATKNGRLMFEQHDRQEPTSIRVN